MFFLRGDGFYRIYVQWRYAQLLTDPFSNVFLIVM